MNHLTFCSSLAATDPQKLMGHPRNASRNNPSWISGRKSVSQNAAKVKALLFCHSGECFQEQKSHPVLSSPASSRVAKPSTALQITALPSACKLGPSRMNNGSQKYSMFLECAEVLGSVRIFRTDLRTTRWSSCGPANPNRTPQSRTNPEKYINKYSSG